MIGFHPSGTPSSDLSLGFRRRSSDKSSSTPRSLLTFELSGNIPSGHPSVLYDSLSHHSSLSSSLSSTSSHSHYSLSDPVHDSQKIKIGPDELRRILRYHPSEGSLAKAAKYFKNHGENPISVIEMRNWAMNIKPPLRQNDRRTWYFNQIREIVKVHEASLPWTPDELLQFLKIHSDRRLSSHQESDLEGKLKRFVPVFESGKRFTLKDYHDSILSLAQTKPILFETIKGMLHHSILPHLLY